MLLFVFGVVSVKRSILNYLLRVGEFFPGHILACFLHCVEGFVDRFTVCYRDAHFLPDAVRYISSPG